MDFQSLISKFLSTPNVNIFDECVKEIELEFGKPVTNLCDLKKREDKKKKGDVWEKFCKEWLIASDKYKTVWLLQEWLSYCQSKNQSTLGLKTKQDNGIDLIGELNSGKLVAIQCKYRKNMKKVTWNTISTFLGLCERSGPWGKYIVMTNGKGVTNKIGRSPKDQSICLGTFRGTKRTQWLKMAGIFHENKLEEVQPKKKKMEKLPNLEELREIRLKKFIKQS